MIRFVSIVIVIWGLVVQPLMAAAMPIKMMEGTTYLPMTADTGMLVDTGGHDGDDFSLAVADSSKVSCHGNVPEEGSLARCDNCSEGCASGACASSCPVGSTPGAFQKMSTSLDLNNSALVITTTGARSYYGFPSRIFHPPKHA